jgi:hypothetical protein
MAKKYDINTISGTTFTYQLYANMNPQMNGVTDIQASGTATAQPTFEFFANGTYPVPGSNGVWALGTTIFFGQNTNPPDVSYGVPETTPWTTEAQDFLDAPPINPGIGNIFYNGIVVNGLRGPQVPCVFPNGIDFEDSGPQKLTGDIIPGSAGIRQTQFISGVWYTIGNKLGTGGVLASSADGINWAEISTPFTEHDSTSILMGMPSLLLVVDDSGNWHKSTDFSTFTLIANGPSNISQVVYGDSGIYVSYTSGFTRVCEYTTDGISWTNIPFNGGTPASNSVLVKTTAGIFLIDPSNSISQILVE